MRIEYIDEVKLLMGFYLQPSSERVVNCNDLAAYAQYIIGFCQPSQGEVRGVDGELYPVVSGQLFDEGGFNVIDDYWSGNCAAMALELGGGMVFSRV